jgi:hypothetical protein
MPTRVKAASTKAEAPADEAKRASDVIGAGAVPADYADRNRAAWDRWAIHYTATGRSAWMEKELKWGIWGIPSPSSSSSRAFLQVQT